MVLRYNFSVIRRPFDVIKVLYRGWESQSSRVEPDDVCSRSSLFLVITN